MKKRYFKHTISAIIALLLLACGETTGEENPDYSALINSAWLKFSAANYSGAVTDFTKAKGLDGNIPTAFTGLAWSHLMLKEYSSSQTEFDQGIILSDTIPDLFAGKAFLLNARNLGPDISNSISAVNTALVLNSNWVFANGLSLDRVDLLVIKAQAQFLINQFSASLITIKEIDPNFNADIATPEGRAALQAKIESYNSSLN